MGSKLREWLEWINANKQLFLDLIELWKTIKPIFQPTSAGEMVVMSAEVASALDTKSCEASDLIREIISVNDLQMIESLNLLVDIYA